MRAPRWAQLLLGVAAPSDRRAEVLGDLDESHALNVHRYGAVMASIRTGLEAVDMSVALLRRRLGRAPVGNERPGSQGVPADPKRFRPLPISWLDLKLGLRMLVKYPGLTTVSTIAIAFAVALGAGSVEFASDFFYPTMPFEEGDRIVQIRNQNIAAGRTDFRALHDFERWREEARSVVEMGAWRDYQRNVGDDRGQARPVLGAEVTAAALELPRIPPALGRLLTPADEGPDAPAVAVIGHDLWVGLFGRDEEIIGRPIRIGSELTTVVGVMPPDFRYPLNHGVWTPLRLDASQYPEGQSPAIRVVARLAPGGTLEQARAEFTALGLRSSRDHPETHAELRTSLVQFGRIPEVEANNWLADGFFFGVVVGFTLVMMLVCSNVALLLFARTAARGDELTVRTALGASRGRIITQLFVEALVLAVLSAAVGLSVGHIGLEWVLRLMGSFYGGDDIGFWFDAALSPGTILVTLALTVLAAVIAGVLPARRATSEGIHVALQRTRGSGPGFGRFWTGVIVSQIAITVAFVPIVIVIGYQTATIHAADMGFRAEEYLSVNVRTASEALLPTTAAGILAGGSADAASLVELKRRLEQESPVRGVALSSHLPGANHPLRRVRTDRPTDGNEATSGYRVATGFVDPDFFDVLGVPILAGRGFGAADAASARRVAVVNEDFARVVLEDRNPIGRRFAYLDPRASAAEQAEEWYEIVGVVGQIAMQIDPDLDSGAGIYHPLRPADLSQLRMSIQVGPDPTEFSSRLHEVALEVDPLVMLSDIRPMSEGAWETELLYESWLWVIIVAAGIGLLLTLAGIYSIVAFTVSRRTREIGVRVALGAGARRVIAAIFYRALMQIGGGVLLGGVLSLGFVLAASEGRFTPGVQEALIIAAYLALMLGVCLAGCAVPVRRALAIEPTEALRSDG